MSISTIRQLSKELQEVARRELFETEENVISDLKLLKEWIAQSPHLKINVDDQFLIAFIRHSKHNLEKVKQKLEVWCTYITHSPDIYASGLLTEKTLELLKLGLILPFSKPANPDGPRIVLTRVGHLNFDLYPVQDYMKLNAMIATILMKEDDNMSVTGCVAIYDFSGVKIDQFLSWYLSVPLKKHMSLGTDASIVRIKQLYLINIPIGFHAFLNLAMKFLTDKFKARISDHSSMDSFFSVFPKSMMPLEYGGDNGTVASIVKAWEEKVPSYRNFFEDLKSCGVDEEKRVGEPKNPETLFGCVGTFKKLEFD